MDNRTTIVDVTLILGDSLTAEGIEQWLRAANRLLGRATAIDMIHEGDSESISRAA